MKFRTPSAALAVAVVALVVALGGVATAASTYLITSTRQISPAVLKSLRGLRGKPGARGPRGHKGADGATGSTGSTGATSIATVTDITETISYTNGVSGISTMTCPNGAYAVGFSSSTGTIDTYVDSGMGGSQFTAFVVDLSPISGTGTATLYGACVSGQGLMFSNGGPVASLRTHNLKSASQFGAEHAAAMEQFSSQP